MLLGEVVGILMTAKVMRVVVMVIMMIGKNLTRVWYAFRRGRGRGQAGRQQNSRAVIVESGVSSTGQVNVKCRGKDV